MDKVLGFYVRLKMSNKGQTMGEYALILAAVAVVAYAGFKVLGNDINGMANSLGGNL
jgi:Flp pilus assembly pilin Flp